jgi:FkbM family methyltransferase
LLYPSPEDKTNTYALLGTYDLVADEVLRLEPGMCFVDVGANCGVFALIAAARVGPTGLVIAFEPSPREFKNLVRNLAANGVNNVLALPLAVCEQTGPIAFAVGSSRHSGRNAIAPSGGIGCVFGLNPADFPGLTGLIGDRRIVLKLDVEGYEVKALNALAELVRTHQVEKLIVEVDSRQLAHYGDTPAALYARMDALGYVPSRGVASHHYDEVFVPLAPAVREPAA